MLGAALFFCVLGLVMGWVMLTSSTRFLLWTQRRQAAIVRRHELLLLEQEASFARDRAALAEALDLPDTGVAVLPPLRKPETLKRDHAKWLLEQEEKQERDREAWRRRMLGG